MFEISTAVVSDGGCKNVILRLLSDFKPVKLFPGIDFLLGYDVQHPWIMYL